MAAPGQVPFGSPAGPGGADMSGASFHLGLHEYHPPSLDGAYQHQHHHHHHPHAHQPQQHHHHFAHPQAHPQFARTPQSQPQPQQQSGAGQFGILAPTNVPQNAFIGDPHASLDGSGIAATGATAGGKQSDSHLNARIVVDPPDLAAWRDKLFHVDDMIVLTNDQFETYFPHIDNVYSHRSTQRYKRKPFVSHYWDCRMKGRPPGTPKSDDPSKKKRKRKAREKDLCDVKIKITEYSPGAQIQFEDGLSSFTEQQPPPIPLDGQKFWTIQRVNGNGGNGKGDGVAGPHRHTLEKSDEIKKNSVQRYVAKQEKETKKAKPQQRKMTGTAFATARKHSKDSSLKLYGASFCPFSQRVWIALEAKGIAYQYCEVDPFRMPASALFLEANPRGPTPGLRHDDWTCVESGVILEYLEDLDSNVALFPSDPKLKATCRTYIDHINKFIVPAFYSALQSQNGVGLDMDNPQAAENLEEAITKLIMAADESGPYFLGSNLSLVDVHFAPFALRLSRVVAHVRPWQAPLPGTRWYRWLEALEGNAFVKATTSGREFYAETIDLLLQKSPGP